MGSRHDWYVDDTNETGSRGVSYNHGFVNTTERWRTVMASNNNCVVFGFNCTRLTQISNPNVEVDDVSTGVVEGTSTSCVEGNNNNPPCDADNARVLNDRAFTVANFRQTVAPAPDDWTFNNDSGSYVPGSNSQIQVVGTGVDWSSSFWRTDGSTIENSERITLDFKVSELNSLLHLGVAKTSGDYERLAILDYGGTLYAQIYRQNAAEQASYYELLSASEFQADTWYTLSITIDDQYGFFIDIEERDNPETNGTFRDVDQLLEAGSEWRFTGFILNETVQVDNYLEETVVISPPPADDWLFNNPLGSYVNGSNTEIQVAGTGIDWNSSFQRKTGGTIENGQRITFDFKVEEEGSLTHLGLARVAGSYERLALLAYGGTLYVQIYRQNAVEQFAYHELLSVSDFEPDVWYEVSLTIDDQYGSFIEIADKSNPAISGSFRDSEGLLASGSQWSFFGFLYQSQVNLDNYLEEDVTLSPPPADDWVFNEGNGSYVTGSNSQIYVTGTGVDWGASFWRKDGSTVADGEEITFDFKVDAKNNPTILGINKQTGDFERLAILDYGGSLYAETYRQTAPNSTVYHELLSPTAFLVDTWYSVTITLDDINGFSIDIVERDNPSNSGSYQDADNLLSAGSAWSFAGNIYQNVVNLDNYVED